MKLLPIDDFEGNFYSNGGKTHERVKVASTGASAVARVPDCKKRLATPAFIGCVEHGHSNQPGPAHKGGYSPHPAVGHNFAATGPDAHTPAHTGPDGQHARKACD
jgi:hypothetical protein